MRNWPATLFPASFKGVAFFVESDKEKGGRRLVKHQFPMRDEPFLEDLGEDLREFAVTAYLASDAADAQAAALVAAATRRGAGPLVLPDKGVVQARCESAERAFAKDRQGYVAVELKLVREGARRALPSVLRLAQAAFNAGEAVAAAAGASLAVRVATQGQPDFVVARAVEGLRAAAATVEAVRAAIALDPAQGAVLGAGAQALYDEAPALLSRAANPAASVGERVVTLAQDIVQAALRPEAAAAAFREVLDLPAYVAAATASATGARGEANAAALDRLLRLAAATAMADAYVRRAYPSRREGITARAEIAAYFEGEMSRCQGEADAPLFVALQELRGRVAEYLSALITDLAPVVIVETGARMPSLWLAWRLYQDPARGAELVARNGVPHPAFLPRRVEALAR